MRFRSRRIARPLSFGRRHSPAAGDGRRVARGRRPSRPRRRAVDGAAAADRRPRRRARDLAQPDPHAVPGAGRARRQRRRRAADRSADRHGRRHRGHRQHLLQPARVITRRLRVGLPPWHRQHLRVRRRRARSRSRMRSRATPEPRSRTRRRPTHAAAGVRSRGRPGPADTPRRRLHRETRAVATPSCRGEDDGS